jgi:intracellular multiplication protein IcmW
MPDLNHQAVHEFWKEYQDPSIYRVIALMESAEDWTLDGNKELETALQKLGDTLDNLGKVELAQEKAIIELVAHIKTGRGLRILMALDMAYPGAASKILQYAEENTQSPNDMPGFLLQRNLSFERLRLLGRVFASARIQLVVQTLEAENEYS